MLRLHTHLILHMFKAETTNSFNPKPYLPLPSLLWDENPCDAAEASVWVWVRVSRAPGCRCWRQTSEVMNSQLGKGKEEGDGVTYAQHRAHLQRLERYWGFASPSLSGAFSPCSSGVNSDPHTLAPMVLLKQGDTGRCPLPIHINFSLTSFGTQGLQAGAANRRGDNSCCYKNRHCLVCGAREVFAAQAMVIAPVRGEKQNE